MIRVKELGWVWEAAWHEKACVELALLCGLLLFQCARLARPPSHLFLLCSVREPSTQHSMFSIARYFNALPHLIDRMKKKSHLSIVTLCRERRALQGKVIYHPANKPSMDRLNLQLFPFFFFDLIHSDPDCERDLGSSGMRKDVGSPFNRVLDVSGREDVQIHSCE